MPDFDKINKLAEERFNDQNFCTYTKATTKDFKGKYIKIPKKPFRSEYLKKYGNPYVLYFFLMDSCWTNSSVKDKYNIYKKCWLKGEVAACWPNSVLAEYFGCTKQTIRNWISELIKMDYIIKREQPGDPNILILGRHENNKIYYFSDYPECKLTPPKGSKIFEG